MTKFVLIKIYNTIGTHESWDSILIYYYSIDSDGCN